MSNHFSAKKFFQEILFSITVYEPNEKRAVAFLIFEKLLKISRTDILTDKLIPELSVEKLETLASTIEQLNQHVPVQYLLKEADFFGHIFYVDSLVLIPRQETEELVACVIGEVEKFARINILDVCTGSGCIAISLAKALPNAEVSAVDIFEGALAVAQQNAASNSTSIKFYKEDILAPLSPSMLGKQYDVIVSNPPYVTDAEKSLMAANVLNHEPHLALFVTDETPLIFYNSILNHAQKLLKMEGKIYFEINEQYGIEVAQLMKEKGFENIRIIKDLSNKDRMAVATWNK